MSPEDLERLYQKIGKAIWYVQNVEGALCTLIMVVGEIKEPGALENGVIDEIFETKRLFTFGNLLKNAQKENILDQNLLRDLHSLKKERDWLVHRINHELSQELYVQESRRSIFDRIEQISVSSLALQSSILEVLYRYSQEKGLDTAALLGKASR